MHSTSFCITTPMNLSLLDPFSLAQDYPETLSKRLSEYLRAVLSSCIHSNHSY